MSSGTERKFINLRKRLDQFGYRQPLALESVPLVDKLFVDLCHTTDSLRKTVAKESKIVVHRQDWEAHLEPYKKENARLLRENNQVHSELLRAREDRDTAAVDVKATIRKLENENADLRFLNSQYVYKVQTLEKESVAKSERIERLQEKNLQAVVQIPGGKERQIPFRRQRMSLDATLPAASGPVRTAESEPDDPYVADLLRVADSRMDALTREVGRLSEDLEIANRKGCNYRSRISERDAEIQRLGRLLEGGRSYDVVAAEAHSRNGELLLNRLNLQVEYLQAENKELGSRLKEALRFVSSHTDGSSNPTMPYTNGLTHQLSDSPSSIF